MFVIGQLTFVRLSKRLLNLSVKGKNNLVFVVSLFGRRVDHSVDSVQLIVKNEVQVSTLLTLFFFVTDNDEKSCSICTWQASLG
jgi:hypothetical protein